ncbi:alpha/beta hydrolase family protein [Thalassomonas haliotis]|uniref:S9 family peptidase n=1 Tax=Thalassomonas haliotis TaxID=485448 RepID=A0ABY7VJ04_9GAMM|nr:alpha/beta fold hydrolase [Thalassomonas haliotis]WDE13149.1 S9 family peptidase [Thalassomonas haliotis]
MINKILLCLTLCFAINAQAKDWQSLFDHAQYQNAKISPDGKYLAVALLSQGRRALIFFDSKTMKPVGSAKFRGRKEVGSYYWVNNERVVITINQRDPWLEEAISYGELYAVNYDGSKGELIYGYQAGEMQTGSHIKKKKAIRGWAKIIDRLKEDKKHILISSTPMSDTGERLPTVMKLNIYNGKVKRKLGTSPIPFARFITDTSGELRALTGTDKNDHRQLYLRQDGDWVQAPQDLVGKSVSLLSVDASGKYLYTLDNKGQDLTGVFKLNLEDFTYKSVYTDKVVDITDVEMTTDGRTAYALRVDEDYPTYLILNKKAEEAQTFKNLLATFPYSKVNITSKTEDGNIYVVLVSSDVDPGTLYLFDKKQNQISSLFRFKPDINSAELAQVEPVQLEASDGRLLHGYFTAAKSTGKNEIAPLVVLVHGGPHGVRNYWSFSSQVQYLALNGYSVLQVNYRGSDGYGRDFAVAGHQAWGTRIQQDINDAYQWLIKQNKAKAGHACIMGGSFGAYSAIQSAVKFPDTYQCAIANAGIYDLELMFEDGDIQEKAFGLSYLKRVLGTDKAQLKSMSPVNHVEKIKIPLLLAHGEKDERAPFEHAKRLRKALDRANKSYQWFVIDDESHGFFNPENQKAYMKKVVSFLDSHLI